MIDATKEPRVKAEVRRLELALTPMGWIVLSMLVLFLAGFVLGIWWARAA